ncbi:hypothetical protein ElyMa_005392300 [Elysia marginata]|uniref:Secreted protein n=1 Tax=Elysia marginata TaxID=1093978 RepID=A0AAV4EFH2_9GAST|nr:hypothetical protein ElyMa_005392300 [Elysia marginata]
MKKNITYFFFIVVTFRSLKGESENAQNCLSKRPNCNPCRTKVFGGRQAEEDLCERAEDEKGKTGNSAVDTVAPDDNSIRQVQVASNADLETCDELIA